MSKILRIKPSKLLTPKQNEVVKRVFTEKPKVYIFHGAVRSGKTNIGVKIFTTIIRANRNKGIKYIIGGATQSSIRYNILDEIEELLGIDIKLDKYNRFELYGNTIICADGEKSNAWKKIRGFTAAGAYLNETTTLHKTFVTEVMARCSLKNSIVFMDTNPDNPNHTIYKDYILNAGHKLSTGRLHIAETNFSIFDNTFLDKEYVESFEKSLPNGVTKQRLVYGQWVVADGIIYDLFRKDKHTFDIVDYSGYDEYYISIDYGTANATAFLLIGANYGINLDGERVITHADVLKEYVYSGRDTGVKMTDSQYADALINFMGDLPIEYVIIDPSALSFKTELDQRGIPYIDANNDVLTGIRFTRQMIYSKKLRVSTDCVGLIEEFGMYAWDSKASSQGIDKPIKEHDHACDALRYFCMTVIYSDTQRKEVQTLENLAILGGI